MERSEVVAINEDLRARAARIRDTNAATAEDVATVIDAIVKLTDDAREEGRDDAAPSPAAAAQPAADGQ